MLEVEDAGQARLAELQLALAEKLYRLADATQDARVIARLDLKAEYPPGYSPKPAHPRECGDPGFLSSA